MNPKGQGWEQALLCTELRRRPFLVDFFLLERDEESAEGERFGTLFYIHRTAGAARFVAVGLLAWSVLSILMWHPQWQAASVWWDTECLFWGGQVLLIMWGQCKGGKVCSSKAGGPGPARCRTGWQLTWSYVIFTPNYHLVVMVTLYYSFYPFWMQPLHQECCNIDFPPKRCAVTDFILNSLLPDFTWPLKLKNSQHFVCPT